MSRKRKKWEPEHRFGGNPTDFWRPKPLGENQSTWFSHIPKTKGKRR